VKPGTDSPDAAAWDIGALRLRPALVWSMALSSLRLRIGRSMLTMLTVATATAFLVYLATMPREADPTERQSWVLMVVLALVVSAAGVLNTMLMSVSQRYREIGTIKCLGALDGFVLLSVLLEAALLGLAGALAGAAAGLGVSVGLAAADHGRAVLQHLRLDALPLKLAAAFAIGMALTVLGAAVPAWIASRMPPMEAMRGEK